MTAHSLSPGRHGLLVYRTDDHLVRSVARFASAGLDRGAPAILIPSTAHRAPLIDAMRGLGVDVEGLQAAGTLVLADADALSEACLAAGSVDGVWDGLMAMICSLEARGSRRFVVWGETPDRLLKKGGPALCWDLERRWCEATRAPKFSVLCGFQADLLAPETYEGDFQAACGTHTHLLAIEDQQAVTAALKSGLKSTMDFHTITMMRTLADADGGPAAKLPDALRRMLWIRAHMPRTFTRVLASGREAVAA